MSVAAGNYGGFIRVNGNPMIDAMDVKNSSSTSVGPPPPTSPYPGGVSTTGHAHNCTASANRELQCILKELKFITSR